VHVAMYAPIGAMVWLRFGGGRRQAFAAGVAAGLASLAVELGRWMKPGLQPDFNEVVIGGLAAWLTVMWAPRVWRLLLDAVAEVRSGFPEEGGTVAPYPVPPAVPSSVQSPVPSWPGLTRPSAHERSGVDGRVKPGHHGMGSGIAGGDELRSATADGDELGSGTAYRDGLGSGTAHGDELRSGLASGDRPGWLAARAAVALVCLGALGWFLARYPLPPAPLAAVLALYAAALWRWPGLWLVVVPAVLPAFDLTMWTGWLMASESDAFLLVTLGVLVLRAPPVWRDVRLRGLPGAVLALVAVTLVVEVLRGLTSPYVLPQGSADPYLLPINALRLAKGEAWAFVLLPFLRARWRRAGDAPVLLGWGMVAGLAAVSVAALIERALFPGVFNFTADYRIVATFSSMQVGGDDVGTYLAMALPFLVVCLLRLRPIRVATLLLLAAGAIYALLVTYARAAYGGAVLGAAVTLVLYLPMARRRRGIAGGFAVLALFATVIGVTLGFGLDSGMMSQRLRRVLPDFDIRLANWVGGVAWIDPTPSAWLVGMGLGTYPRVTRLRAVPAQQPTNFVLERSGGRRFLRLRTGSKLYLGQKVPVKPDRLYRLSLRYRVMAPGGGLAAMLCEKLLLYSDTCHGEAFGPAHPGVWQTANATLSTTGLDQRAVLGLLRRPVELSLFGTEVGETVDVTDVRLLDGRGGNLVRNGGFRRGTDRWYFTDDDHLDWQIKNQYLTTLFEGGVLGVLAYLLLGGVALGGAARAALRDAPMAAPIAGSLLAFLACGVFDDELAAPRMATLFYLIAFAGLCLWVGDGSGRRL